MAFFYLNTIGDFHNIVNDLPVDKDSVLKKKCNKTPYSLSIITYDKTKEMTQNSGYVRSVVINEKTKEVLSFAPPKALHKIPNGLDFTKCQIEELVEGTMMNLFWNNTSNEWDVSTRNTIDANSSFITMKPFRVMFIEAIVQLNINLSEFEKDKSYSFVMQHPENRIATQFKETRLYLIDIFEIQNIVVNGQVVDTCVKQYSHPLNTCISIPTISFPAIFNGLVHNLRDIKLFLRDHPEYMGITIRHEHENEGGLPERYRIRNFHFEKIMALRGNHASLLMRYLELKQEKKIQKYLKQFPENTVDLEYYSQQYQLFISFLHIMYIRVYIKKDYSLEPEWFLTKTLKQIHWNYTSYLKKFKCKVNYQFVYDYFASLEPRVQKYNLDEFLFTQILS